MIDIAALAGSLIAGFLIPMVKKSGEELLSDLQKRAGKGVASEVAEETRSLWDRIKGKFANDDETGEEPAEKAVIDGFEKAPELMQPSLEGVLTQLFGADETLRTAAEALVRKDPGAPGNIFVQAGDNSTVGVVDASGAVITGDVTGVSIQGNANDGPKPTPEAG